ncbi:MAG: 50S ribosomal protein L18 [Candidatus Magasanikbacteria bacterium]|nr:50S ribosomal protein L18 [Candidatus Magasanikbacteria bacterium]
MKRLITKTRDERRTVRHSRVRAVLKGTSAVPRLSVFRGLKSMTLQLIDDVSGKTICQATTAEVKKSKVKLEGRSAKVAEAFLAGKLLAEKSKDKKITRIVFDRGGYKYHGRVAAAAEGAREGGLSF